MSIVINRNETLILKSAGLEYKACLNIANSYPSPGQFLHPEEENYLSSLQYPKRINQYLLGRYSAKNAISQFINEKNLNLIHIKNGIFNHPVVRYYNGANIQISIAHSDDMACSIVFNEEILIGIDLEKISESSKRAVLPELTPHETGLLIETSGSHSEDCIIFWTAKESLSKIIKTGLTIPLKLLEIDAFKERDGYFFTGFTYFPQYTSISWIENGRAFSITYPKKLTLESCPGLLRPF